MATSIPTQAVSDDPRAGRCFHCGLLAAVDTFHSTVGPGARYVEVSPAARYNGVGRPVCLVGERDIPAAIEERSTAEGGNAVRAVLEDDMRCPEWWLYTPGISPQDHRRESVMLGLEQRRHASEERIAEQNRLIAEAIAEATKSNADAAKTSERIGQQGIQIAEISHSHNRKWTIVFAVFAVVTFVLGLLQLLYPNGIVDTEFIRWLAGLLSGPSR